MTERERRVAPKATRLFRSTKIQGIAVRPGDAILVVDPDGVSHRHIYAGRTKSGVWTEGPLSSMLGLGCGPHRLETVRHPDILTGIAKAIDESE